MCTIVINQEENKIGLWVRIINIVDVNGCRQSSDSAFG